MKTQPQDSPLYTYGGAECIFCYFPQNRRNSTVQKQKKAMFFHTYTDVCVRRLFCLKTKSVEFSFW